MTHFHDGESFLKHAHALFPAETPKWFDRPLVGGGTSYERLVRCVPVGATHVLDLACGDGVLCERLLETFPSNVAVTGIDLSDVELAAAEKRLAQRGVSLLLAPAQALPLPDQSVDAVLCHMALMLMTGLEGVLREVGRVLKPGGRFAAVVGRGWRPGPTQEHFREAFRQALGEYGGTPFGALGDERTRTREGLTAAVAASGVFGGKPEFEDLDISLALTPADLSEFMMGAYDTVVLPASGREWMRNRLARAFESLQDDDGKIPYSLALRLMSVAK